VTRIFEQSQEQPVNVGCEEGCHANGHGRALPFERQAHRDGIDPQQPNEIAASGPIELPGVPSPRKKGRRTPIEITQSTRADHLITVIAAFFPSRSVSMESSIR
jgi:hypothetical protein